MVWKKRKGEKIPREEKYKARKCILDIGVF
jgi:hypothetical protein